MPCRVVAKQRQKKGENQPLFAFCAVLPTEQENTQPALQTLLTNGKIPIAHMLLSTWNIIQHLYEDRNCSGFLKIHIDFSVRRAIIGIYRKQRRKASMPRPPRCRRICGAPQVDTFCPNGCENTEPILLTLDEYEVIRLVEIGRASCRERV